MPSPPRPHAEGLHLHVIARGNGGSVIFRERRSYKIWQDLLAQGIARTGDAVLAYVWMPTHVHMLLRCGPRPTADLMRPLLAHYARWVNLRAESFGHVFQNRFRAIAVDSDPYWFAVLKYIHLNPVQAGLADTPDGYAWSSYRALSQGNAPDWLDAAAVWRQFADDAALARRRLAAHTLSRDDAAWRIVERHAAPPGRGQRRESSRLRLPGRLDAPLPAPVRASRSVTSEDVLAAAAACVGLTPAALKAPGGAHRAAKGRAIAAWLARALAAQRAGSDAVSAPTLSMLAAACGRDVSTLSRQLARLDQARADDEALAQRLGDAQQALVQARRVLADA